MDYPDQMFCMNVYVMIRQQLRVFVCVCVCGFWQCVIIRIKWDSMWCENNNTFEVFWKLLRDRSFQWFMFQFVSMLYCVYHSNPYEKIKYIKANLYNLGRAITLVLARFSLNTFDWIHFTFQRSNFWTKYFHMKCFAVYNPLISLMRRI